VSFTDGDLPDSEGGKYAALMECLDQVTGLGDGRCREGYELYNVVSDRFEQTELSATAPDALDTFKAKLDEVVAIQGNGWLDVPDCAG
jgi:hypothetical protein